LAGCVSTGVALGKAVADADGVCVGLTAAEGRGDGWIGVDDGEVAGAAEHPTVAKTRPSTATDRAIGVLPSA
jgi:hypothetical protein